jgi:hypothetical protein
MFLDACSFVPAFANALQQAHMEANNNMAFNAYLIEKGVLVVTCHAHLDDSVEVCQFLDVIPLDRSGGGLLGSGQQPVAPQFLHNFGLHLWVLADRIQRPRRSVARRCRSHGRNLGF